MAAWPSSPFIDSPSIGFPFIGSIIRPDLPMRARLCFKCMQDKRPPKASSGLLRPSRSPKAFSSLSSACRTKPFEAFSDLLMPSQTFQGLLRPSISQALSCSHMSIVLRQVLRPTLAEVLTPLELAKFDEFSVRSFVEDSSSHAWCAGPEPGLRPPRRCTDVCRSREQHYPCSACMSVCVSACGWVGARVCVSITNEQMLRNIDVLIYGAADLLSTTPDFHVSNCESCGITSTS